MWVDLGFFQIRINTFIDFYLMSIFFLLFDFTHSHLSTHPLLLWNLLIAIFSNVLYNNEIHEKSQNNKSFSELYLRNHFLFPMRKNVCKQCYAMFAPFHFKSFFLFILQWKIDNQTTILISINENFKQTKLICLQRFVQDIDLHFVKNCARLCGFWTFYLKQKQMRES